MSALCSSAYVFAQSTPVESPVLVDGKKAHLTGFGSALLEGSQINNQFTLLKSFSGALLINRTVFVGGYFTESFQHDYNWRTDNDNNVFRHAGIQLGYIVLPKCVVSPVVSLQGGYGWYKGRMDSTTTGTFHQAAVLMPRVEIQVNILRWLRLSVGTSYRYTTGDNFFKKYNFSNPTGFVALHFGKF